ncbi:MAG: tetratricopeptide repeat protein [Isosphaeraceae bacterium]
MVLLLRAEHREASARQDEALRAQVVRKGVPLLRWAEKISTHPPRALYDLRAEFEEALGQAEAAGKDRLLARSTPVKTPEELRAQGRYLLERGRPKEAEPFLVSAINADRSDFWGWFYLGLCRADLGRHLEAADHFATCTALAPDFAWGYCNQGNELARLNRLDEARAAYDVALDLNPNFLEALVNRGLVCQESEPETAERDLARAWKLGYRKPAVLAAHAVALDRMGRSDEAIRRFDQALRLHPDDPSILLGRAAYLLRRDPERSRADFENLLKLEPTNARARFGLAQLAIDRGDTGEALALLGMALRDDPTLIDAYELRAVILGRLGDRKALEDVDRLIASPSDRRLYNAACAVARLAVREPALGNRAIDLLRDALRLGFPRDGLRDDPDLASIRDRSDFPADRAE